MVVIATMEAMSILACLILGILIPEVSTSAGNQWTYRGSLGPDHWHLDYPHCGGVKQSPIDVITDDVIIDIERLTPVVFSGFDVVSSTAEFTLENNGHTVKVTLNDKKNQIKGGGLPGVFVAEQFHFHWGATDSRGSEHSLNGNHFPMEMHVVHYNKKYGNITEAIDKKDGLAVLGFFFEVGRFNRHFDEIIHHFQDIKFKNDNVSIHSIPLVQLMPAKLLQFYRYQGSLTTPPCYESVTWTLFNQTIEIAEEQLEEFRTTIFENDESEGGVSIDISDDFRPVQCMHGRRVYASHSSLKFPKNPPPNNSKIVQENPTSSASIITPSVLVLALLIVTIFRM
ncbi:carbonic anhydrase [Mactra antiquata]